MNQLCRDEQRIIIKEKKFICIKFWALNIINYRFHYLYYINMVNIFPTYEPILIITHSFKFINVPIYFCF